MAHRTKSLFIWVLAGEGWLFQKPGSDNSKAYVIEVCVAHTSMKQIYTNIST